MKKYNFHQYQVVFIYFNMLSHRAYERGISRYIGPGPDSKEGPYESLKGHMVVTIDALF